MSKALKCNRCHKCFDPLDQGSHIMVRFINPIIQDSEDVKLRTVGRLLYEEEKPDGYIDLCPDCAEPFILFMEGNPLAMDENHFDKPDIHRTKDEKSIYNTLSKQGKEVFDKINAIGKDLWGEK